jgi:hypothetical protein
VDAFGRHGLGKAVSRMISLIWQVVTKPLI